MANLEIQIGADSSDLNAELAAAEAKIKRLSDLKVEKVKLGLDTKELDADIKDAKASLKDLQQSIKDTSKSFSGAKKPMADAGNTLTNFSRIAQDAPFGIMGIGNNLTATAEAFSSLSRNAGGAGGALKALAGSLMGGGGVLLAISLVTTAFTVMSQKGITVGDVIDKMTGKFDAFKKSLIEVSQEAAKNSGSEIANLKSLVNVAQDDTISREKRLIAVKKLQEEYPAYFGNLNKETILNGDVTKAVKEVTDALIARAKIQAFAGKIGELSAEKVGLREKEAAAIKLVNDAIKKKAELEKRLTTEQFNEATYKSYQQISRALDTFRSRLEDIQNPLKENIKETQRWQDEINKINEVSIGLDFKEEKTKKPLVFTPQVEIIPTFSSKGIADLPNFNIEDELNKQVFNKKTGIFSSLAENMEKDREAFIARLKMQFPPISKAMLDFINGMNEVLRSSFESAFSGIGDAIGQALANGGNVLQAIGASLLSTMGSLLSSIGDKLIALGSAAVLGGTVLSTMFTPAGIGAGIAAIALGTALKAGGGFLGSKGNQISSKGSGGSMSNGRISAGNSVSNPSSSISNGGSFSSGTQNVVFEISGQSLIGVLSNTMNKNVKLGGVIKI